ncbi:MAG: HAD family hydrolase [Acidobacteria bacterium]|nr:MAG: HAD family hydrolase [Acidobacteriota bacterium]
MKNAVIFDVDGTLVDSVGLHAEAWHEAFHHFGFEIPTAAIRTQIGKGGDKLMPFLLSKQDLEEKGEQIEKYRSELFMRKYMPKVRSFPRVRELFERIRADRKKIALASSSDKKQLTILKKIAQVEDVVDCETSADDIDSSKPDPDVFHAALKCLRQPEPDEAIAVGDTPYDAEGARKAGIQTIGLLSGGLRESSLRAAGCIAIYRDPADLLANYETSPLASRVPALR